MFGQSVDAKWLKTKGSKETIRAFSTIIFKHNSSRETLSWQGYEILWKVRYFLYCTTKTSWLHSDWWEGYICLSFETTIEESSWRIHERLWIQTQSHVAAVCRNVDCYKKKLGSFETKNVNSSTFVQYIQ